MATNIGDITDGGLPRILSGLGQTSTGRVFDDGAGTVTVLKQGTVAPRQIRQMQMLLNQFGYRLSTDGIFGAGTAAAVKAIQQKLSMAVTGIYDKALDERIVGMNQSGIIDATSGDVKLVAAGEKTPQTPAGNTAPATPGTGLTIKPVVALVGPPAPGPAAAGPAAESFMDKVKAKWGALRADPNFKYYAAGAAVIGVGGLVLLTAPKPSARQMPSSMQGLYIPPRRKKARKSKSRKS